MKRASPRFARGCPRNAAPSDLETVSELLAESARWMREHGYNAWAPSGFPGYRIRPGLEERTVWLLYEGARSIGTLALDRHPDPEFTASEAVEGGVSKLVNDALIVHRMAVRRDLAGRGLGPLLLDWSSDHAHRSGYSSILLNCARNAHPLQRFYAKAGFHQVATVTSTGRKSGSLWQRPAEPQPHIWARLKEHDDIDSDDQSSAVNGGKS